MGVHRAGFDCIEHCKNLLVDVVSSCLKYRNYNRPSQIWVVAGPYFFLKEYGTFMFIQTNFFFYRSLAVSKILQKKLGMNNDGQ